MSRFARVRVAPNRSSFEMRKSTWCRRSPCTCPEPPFVAAIVVFSLIAIVVTQITSNTAAAAIVIPITISTCQGLAVNPMPYVYVAGAAVNFGLMLPSSSAGPAIAAGYGADLKTMFWQGAKLTALLWALLVVAGYLLARFWPAFGSA
jgi:sodium-dependent dicarboxylate transporter 2/3/5